MFGLEKLNMLLVVAAVVALDEGVAVALKLKPLKDVTAVVLAVPLNTFFGMVAADVTTIEMTKIKH